LTRSGSSIQRADPPAASRSTPPAWLASLRRSWTWYLFIAPNLIIFLVFTLFVWGFLIFLSGHDWSLLDEPAWVGLDNYLQMFADPVFWISLQNTVVYAIVFVALVAVISLSLAMLVNQRLPLIQVFRSAYYLPVVTSISVIGLIWRFILIPRPEGPLNYLIGLIGLPPQEWLVDPNLALLSLTGLQIWATMGYYMILWLASLRNIPRELHEAAWIDGAGRWQVFRSVTLPLLQPTTIFVVMIATIGALQMFGPVYLLTGGGPIHATTTVVYYIWQTAFQSYRMGYSAAVSLVLFACILIVALVQRRLLGWTNEIY
jgi:ABC-type sugar transport system permease subunit